MWYVVISKVGWGFVPCILRLLPCSGHFVDFAHLVNRDTIQLPPDFPSCFSPWGRDLDRDPVVVRYFYWRSYPRLQYLTACPPIGRRLLGQIQHDLGQVNLLQCCRERMAGFPCLCIYTPELPACMNQQCPAPNTANTPSTAYRLLV